MSTHVVNSTTITVTLTPAGGGPQTITFHGHAGGASAEPVKIDITFHDASGTTVPMPGGGVGVPSKVRCPGTRTSAAVYGEIEAQITQDGSPQGSGYVNDQPHDTRCHTPTI